MKKNKRRVDGFVSDNMPREQQWPDFINLDIVSKKPHFNAAVELLDCAIDEGYGDKIALYSPDGNWTYKELLEKTNQIAHVLKDDLGLVTGNRVLLRSANNLFLAACWLAVIKAGGVVVTTIAMLRAKEIRTIAGQCEARFALCDHRLREDMESAAGELKTLSKVLYFKGGDGLGGLENLMKDKPVYFDNYISDAFDIAMIGFTSGTTGKPKGAVHSHHALMAVCESFSKKVVQPTSEDIFSGTAPLGFVYGLGGLLLFPLYARASSVLLENVRTEPLMEAIDRFKVTVLYTAPTAYKALLNVYDAEKLGSLKKCISAGESLPNYVSKGWLEQANIRLIDGIGSTEILHIFVSVQTAEDPLGTLGKAVPGYEARIVDEKGNELPVGEVGLLAVRGPTGCRYLNDERQTNYVVKGWNVTGDTARIDEEGFFWYQARTDGMIISSGYNIAGPEVEEVVCEHPLVKECAVIGVPDQQRGHIVRAYIVLKEGEQPSSELVKDIQNFVKQKTAPYKYPRSVEFIESLPRTLTGKVQHFILREKAKSDHSVE